MGLGALDPDHVRRVGQWCEAATLLTTRAIHDLFGEYDRPVGRKSPLTCDAWDRLR